MKKLLLSLATVALTGAFAMAESVTFDFVNNAYNLGERGGNDYVTTPATATSGDVTLTLDKTSGSGFRLWSDGLRIYKTGEGEATIAVSVPNANVTAIDMTVVKAYASVKVGDTDATWTSSSKTYSWTGTADAPVITIKTTNNSSIATLAITYSPKGSSLESAGLSFPESLYTVLMGQEFTAPALTKATDAAATYTSSNEEVATVDAATGAVTVLAAGTTVIKATTPATATYKAGEASYTLKVVVAYNSISEFYGVGENNKGIVNFPLVVAYQSGINTYAYDAAGNYTLIYGNIGTRERGDVIPAGWEGQYVIFNGLPEIKPVSTPAESVDNVDYTPAEVESVTDDMINYVVVLKKVTFAEDTPSTKSNFEGTTEDGTTYTFRNNFTIETAVAGTYNVELAVSTFNGMQLYPIKYTTWESGVNEITVAEGEAQYYNMQGVRVANPENGMFIRIQNGKAQKVVIK